MGVGHERHQCVPQCVCVSIQRFQIQHGLLEAFPCTHHVVWSKRNGCDLFRGNFTLELHVQSLDIMQALSHFTYHISEGRYLLCDLQGGRYDKIPRALPAFHTE